LEEAMNGRRDYGSGLAEWGDRRQQIREQSYTAISVMKFLAVMGVLACVFDDSLLLPAIIFGVGTAIGICNWRMR
jgi:hypothetical protein